MTAFKLRKDAKDGLRGQCASCEATRRSNYKANNKAIISVKGKEYYRVNKNRILNSVKTYYRENAKDKRAYGRSYHAANAANIAIKDKEHYEANKSVILAKQHTYYKLNRDLILVKAKTYRIENLVRIRKQQRVRNRANPEPARIRSRKHYIANRLDKLAYQKHYKKHNREKVLALHAKYRSVKRERVPKWFFLEKEAIRDLYGEASKLRDIGIDVHVDHIIPLQGRLVSGLHTLANLQILDATENIKKSNSFEL